MFIRSSEETLKSHNLSFLAQGRMDNLLRDHTYLYKRRLATDVNSPHEEASVEVRAKEASFNQSEIDQQFYEAIKELDVV
jgi:hypothetical protein